MSEINYSLWEVPPKPQKKIQGIGYSSTYVTKEEKKSLSYKIWHNMINACYSQSDSIREKQNGNFVSCCNSWHDYRKFQKWFDGNYNGVQGVSMTITRCLISNANLVYNPNNSAIVPTGINSYLKKDNKDTDKLKSLAEKYHSCITEDVYEILTEDIYGEE